MKSYTLSLLAAACAALAPLSAAEKQKTADLSGYPFFAGKKGGYATQYAPGLTATLLLTDMQKQEIAAAQADMANDEGVKAARGISKGDPNVTAEQRDKARASMDAASNRLRERVNAILTSEQKALIEKINAAYLAAIEDTGIVYADKFATPNVKADEAARKRLQEEKNQDTVDQFLHKLEVVLTPAQREAMTRAAEEEAKRSAMAAGSKKPSKK